MPSSSSGSLIAHHKAMQTKIHVVYDPSHITDAREAHLRGETILCLDFWLEQELIKGQIPFVSVQKYIDSEKDVGLWWLRSHEISREWYRLQALSFFQYRGIALGEVVEPLFGEYIARLFFYVRLFLAVRDASPAAVFTFPTPRANDADTTCIAPRIPWVVTDAARMARLRMETTITHPVQDAFTFPRMTWKHRVQALFSAAVNLLPRATYTVYASEYWNYLSSVMPYVKDMDVLLWESVQFYRIPLRHILRHRIRIRQTQGPLSKDLETFARAATAGYGEQLQMAREHLMRYLESVDARLDWTPLFEAMQYLMVYAPRIVADIRVLERAMEKDRPDVVLTMASTGGPQHYFFLMARVARLYKVPSIELQHAGVHLDPRSVYTRIETDVLATYGENIKRYRTIAGHTDGTRLVPIGAPRFDECVTRYEERVQRGRELLASLGLDLNRPILVAAVLFSDTALSSVDLDSYALADYFRVIRAMQRRVPGLQVVFKFRHTKYISHVERYLQKVFDEGDMIAVGDTDLFALLCASDIVVTGNSTLIYQTLLARKPLVLYPWKEVDTYRGEMYETAAPLCRTADSAIDTVHTLLVDRGQRAKRLEQQVEFLSHYRFDGHASERLGDLLRQLARQRQEKR